MPRFGTMLDEEAIAFAVSPKGIRQWSRRYGWRGDFLKIFDRTGSSYQYIGIHSPYCMRRSSTAFTPGMFSAAIRAASRSAALCATPT